MTTNAQKERSTKPETESKVECFRVPKSVQPDALNALLHEYDGLLAENRLALGGTDTKLGIAIGTIVAFFGAGIWKSSPEFFLVVPFLLSFFLVFVIAQLSQVVLLGTQLAVVEKKINDLIHPETLTFFSSTVPRFYDTVTIRDAHTGRKHLSFNILYGTAGFAVFTLVCAFSIWRGLPYLISAGVWSTVFYFATLFVFSGLTILLFLRAATGKKRLIRFIQMCDEKENHQTAEGNRDTH